MCLLCARHIVGVWATLVNKTEKDLCPARVSVPGHGVSPPPHPIPTHDDQVPLTGCDEKGTFPPWPFSYSSHEKNIRQIPVKGCPIEYWTSNSQNWQVIKSKENLRICQGNMTCKCNAVSSVGSWTRKRILGKN